MAALCNGHHASFMFGVQSVRVFGLYSPCLLAQLYSGKSISSKHLCFKGGPYREGDDIIACIFMTLLAHTLWSEFGGLLKICHLAELTLVKFTLVVEPVLPKMADQMRWEFNRAVS